MAQCLAFFLGVVPLQSITLLYVAVAILEIDDIPLKAGKKKLLYSRTKQYLSMSEALLAGITLKCPRILSSILWAFRDRQATDPKDKIYSLLGIVEASAIQRKSDPVPSDMAATTLDLKQIIIEHHAPQEEVYTSLTQAIITSSRPLNILGVR